MSEVYIEKLYEPEELQALFVPDSFLIPENKYASYQKRKNALTLALTGTSITKSAKKEGVCTKTLKHMLKSFHCLASDGNPYFFRVCVPNFKYSSYFKPGDITQVPDTARPNAFLKLLSARPNIKSLTDNFTRPLSKGRPPKSFETLHKKIVTELKKDNLGGYYPLNTKDQGRRALLRYLRKRNIKNIIRSPGESVENTGKKYSSLSDIFEPQLFDRIETDAHQIDIEAKVEIDMPNGGKVTKKVSTLWLIVMIECLSRAILSWQLRVGKGYDSLDLSMCVANSMEPWQRKEFSTPNLEYAVGAGMPSGLSPEYALRRGILLALDNAKAHLATSFKDAYCDNYDGILNAGRPYTPETRGIIEQLFSKLESGALRNIPGGFEPAKKLGENKIRISNYSPDKYPFQIKQFEELLEVIITGYNATPHPSIGNLSPLQYLQVHGKKNKWFFDSVENLDCSREMTCVKKHVVIRGGKYSNTVPHINYDYVRYRSSSLDYARELVGKEVIAKINLKDLRTMQLYISPTESLGTVFASPPWHLTPHSSTTRKLIMQWSREGMLELAGSECAISAYVDFLRMQSGKSTKAVDQLVRTTQIYQSVLPRSKNNNVNEEFEIPRQGWISMDHI